MENRQGVFFYSKTDRKCSFIGKQTSTVFIGNRQGVQLFYWKTDNEYSFNGQTLTFCKFKISWKQVKTRQSILNMRITGWLLYNVHILTNKISVKYLNIF